MPLTLTDPSLRNASTKSPAAMAGGFPRPSQRAMSAALVMLACAAILFAGPSTGYKKKAKGTQVPPNVEEVFKAVDADDWAQMQMLIEDDPTLTPNVARKGLSLLFHAVDKGKKKAVEALLAMGADPNAPNGQDGARPLHAAAVQGDKAILKMLLVAGADINGLDDKDRTPLHRAAHGGKEEAINVCRRVAAMACNTLAQLWAPATSPVSWLLAAVFSLIRTFPIHLSRRLIPHTPTSAFAAFALSCRCCWKHTVTRMCTCWTSSATRHCSRPAPRST